MLTPDYELVEFQNTFTTVIVVTAGTDTAVTSISTVTASYYDPGVTISINSNSVTLSGAYQSIIPITWYWKDLKDQLQSGPTVPAAGTYEKIVQVDSPATLSTNCLYTVVSDAGSDTFTHEVSLISYDKIKTALTSALAGQPTPPMP